MFHVVGGGRPSNRRRLYVSLTLVGVSLLIALTEFHQPVDAQSWLQTGWEAYQAGHMAQAQTAFAKAAASTPESATPAVWMGAVMMARGDNVHAGHWFRLALLLHPSTAQARYALAWLGRLGQPATVQTAVKSVLGRWDTSSPQGIAQFIRASNPDIMPKQAQWEGQAIHEAATQEGVDQRLMTAVVCVESAFDPGAVSPVGALGLGQLMPQTAAELGVNPRDPWQNLVGAARLLRLDLAEFHTLPLTLAAYNAGGGAVRQYGGIPPYPETRSYVWKVLSIFGGLLV
jgi:soluble lytic murein transglycosylase-like protein